MKKSELLKHLEYFGGDPEVWVHDGDDLVPITDVVAETWANETSNLDDVILKIT